MNIGSLPGVTPPASPSGIPNTQSIRRSLAPGCATLLEAGDDTNNSAADFAPGAPTPRANTTAATETECVPPAVITPSTPVVPVTPAPAQAPARPAKKCKKAKKKGKRSAAAAACKKKRRRVEQRRDRRRDGRPGPRGVRSSCPHGSRQHTAADVHHGGPKARTADRTPTFSFSANEAKARFLCKLDGSGFSPCTSPKTFGKLSRGRHGFYVKALDPFSNVDATAAAYSFKVVKK